MRHFSILAAALIGLSTAFATPVKWTCRLPEAAARSFSMYHGETLEFRPEFIVDGHALTNVTALSIYWQTNGMGSAWWSAQGTTFGPSNDVGAASYRFFIRAEAADGILYRANGTIRMLASPGFAPAALELPPKVLDFLEVDYRNAPWADAGALAAAARAATNHTDTATNALQSTVNGKADAFGVGDGLENGEVTCRWYSEALKSNGINGGVVYTKTDPKDIYDGSSGTPVPAYQDQLCVQRLGILIYHDGDFYGYNGKMYLQIRDVARTSINTIVLSPSATNGLASVSAVETVNGNVSRIMVQIAGSNVWFEVTNYLGQADIPSLRLFEMRDGVRTKVWDERTRHDEMKLWTIDMMTNAINVALTDVPFRAWSLYTSGTGAAAPSNTTWVSTESLVLSGGLEFRSFGEISVLVNNGLVSRFTANTNGYTELRTLEGDTLIEFRRTQDRLVDALPTGIQKAPNGSWMIPFSLPSGVKYGEGSPPILYGAADVTGPWYAETNSAAPFAVTWNGDAGEKTWLAAVTQNQAYDKFFFFAKVDAPGRSETRIPGILNAEGGILCKDKRHVITPVYESGQLTWEVEDLGAPAAVEASE